MKLEQPKFGATLIDMWRQFFHQRYHNCRLHEAGAKKQLSLSELKYFHIDLNEMMIRADPQAHGQY